jgi:hypothetical protein
MPTYFCSRPSKVYPNWHFWFWKYTIWQPWCRRRLSHPSIVVEIPPDILFAFICVLRWFTTPGFPPLSSVLETGWPDEFVKNSPNPVWVQKYYSTFTVEKSSSIFWATSVIFKTLPKVNSHTNIANSPNLVTLLGNVCLFIPHPVFFCSIGPFESLLL